MIVATFDTVQFKRKMDEAVQYSYGFIEEMEKKTAFISGMLAKSSINAFYEYLDMQARMNPGMLHHIYEWGQVGNPGARLVELKAIIGGDKSTISADLMQSESIDEGSTEPFYNKAEVMEEGITVTIDEVDAQALFFTDGGEEFFRMGPITIANPGGAATRGAFKAAFEEFYNVYFDEVFLKAIGYYRYFSDPSAFTAGFGRGGYGAGKAAADSWILGAPGDYSD